MTKEGTKHRASIVNVRLADSKKTTPSQLTAQSCLEQSVVPKRPLPPTQVAYGKRKQQTTEMRVSVKPHSHCYPWRGGSKLSSNLLTRRMNHCRILFPFRALIAWPRASLTHASSPSPSIISRLSSCAHGSPGIGSNERGR